MFVIVAGTDTGVGKTFVGALVARALKARGVRVLAVKPIESGCAEAVRDDEDGVILARATGQASPGHALQRLRAAVTPALAADLEGVTIDVDQLVEAVRALGAQADLVLVEGAGGLLSPLSWTRDVRDATDIALALGAPVLLVGADRLGVLHHVRAAARILEARGIALAGVVLSAPAEADGSTGTNLAALERLGFRRDRLATVPRSTSANPAKLEDAAPMAEWLVDGGLTTPPHPGPEL